MTNKKNNKYQQMKRSSILLGNVVHFDRATLPFKTRELKMQTKLVGLTILELSDSTPSLVSLSTE
jgi:hypothetical protein